MIFAAIIFALNYCKKNNGIVFIIPKEFNFLGVFYYIRKQCIQQRKKKEFRKCLRGRKRGNKIFNKIFNISIILLCKTTNDVIHVKQGVLGNDPLKIRLEITDFL